MFRNWAKRYLNKDTKTVSIKTGGDVGNFRGDPDALARLVNGEWGSPPGRSWTLKRMTRARAAFRSDGRLKARTDTLVYSEKPLRDLDGVDKSPVNWSRIVLLIPRDAPQLDIPAAILRVPDVTDAIDAIAMRCRDQYAGKVVAITGSVGKTTVNSMLNTLLAKRLDAFTSGTKNGNNLRAARTNLLRVRDEDVATFEVSRAGLPGAEKLLRPDVVVITAVAEAHMEALGSLEKVAQRKAELLRGLSDTGTAIINRDTRHSETLVEIAREYTRNIITYGSSESADIRLINYDPHERRVTATYRGLEFTYVLGLSGEHNAINSLAVIAALEALGLDPAVSLEDFAQVAAVKGRGQVHEISLQGHAVTIIDQSHNANPSSMKSALRDFTQTYNDRPRTLILGDMLELGPSAHEFHAELVPHIVETKPSRVYLVGSLMREVWQRLPEELKGAHVSEFPDLLQLQLQDLQDGSVLFVKGSHSTGLGKVVNFWCAPESDQSRD